MPESIRAVESRLTSMRRPYPTPFVLLVLLITGIPATAEFYTDWLWFQEVGFEKVFVRSLAAQSLVGTINGCAWCSRCWR